MSDREPPAHVFCLSSPFKIDAAAALPDGLAALIGDWLALSYRACETGSPLKGKDRWRFDSVTSQLLARIGSHDDPAPFLALAVWDEANPPGRPALWYLRRKGRIVVEALARRALAEDRPPTEATPPATNGRTPEAPAEQPDLVTLDQMAAAVHKKKRTLERRKTSGKLPAPLVEGGGGRADLWDWQIIRPWLTKEFGVILPERFPANR